MEPNKELYRNAFSRLTASPELKEKILAATEQTQKPKRFVLRRVLVVAAVAALLFALAMGASAAIGGDMFPFSLGKLERVIPMDGGMAAYIYRSGEKVSVIVQEAPAQLTTTEIKEVEGVPVNPTPDPNSHTIIKLSPPKDGTISNTQVRLISITVASDGENKNAQIYTTTSPAKTDGGTNGFVKGTNDFEEGTNRIVYGNTLSIQVITDEGNKDATIKIVDNSTESIPVEDGDDYKSASVTVEHEGNDDIAEDEK